MRFTFAALAGCIAVGLASLLHATDAAQIPFSLKSYSKQSELSRPADLATPHRRKWTLPRGSNNSAVVFDKYSLALAGGQQRLFVFAAEFHPWRLPVPSLWRDVLQKIRAAGFNTVSIYTHWGLIQPTPDASSIDLTGVNDLDYFLKVAKEVGLFVIVRPGPYINAETTVGGMAPWTVNIDAVLRTNDTAWRGAWRPYIDAISRVVVKHQLVYDPAKAGHLTGGSVILVQADNEYKTGEAERAYMTELVATLKRNGITVPITYNDPGRENNFVDLVDLYGLDSYPQRFDCSHPTTWVPFRDDYLRYHMDTNLDQPFYIPEFQGGSYDPYGGPGYEACGRMTNASFTRVANQALIAQRVTLLSLYMVYGGTNWGGLAEPDVYTSYDYGAALDEHRQTTGKYAELKRQGNLIATFPDLAMTEQIVDEPGFNITQAWDLDADTAVDANVFRTTVLQNPQTRSKFYVVRYDNTTESRRIRFALQLESLGETITAGEWHESYASVNYLNGRDSHIIPVDQQLPADMLLRFSTVNVYRVATVANLVVISLDYAPNQLIEYSLQVPKPDDYFTEVRMFGVSDGGAMLRRVEGEEWEQVMRTHSAVEGAKSVRASIPVSLADGEQRFVVYKTAEGTSIALHLSPTSATQRDFSALARYQDASHASPLHRSSKTNVINRFFDTSEDSVIVLKVDLVRNATYASTDQPLDTLHLWGSVGQDELAAMMALPNLQYIFWNGERVRAAAQEGVEWFYTLHIPGPGKAALEWTPPKLSMLEWRWADSMPEAGAEFDDSKWTDANKTHSFNPYAHDASLDTQRTILFASEYGFHANNIVWRAHFLAPAHAPSDVYIKVEGGRSSAFSAWLNGVYLGSAEADRDKSAAGATFDLPKGALRGDNVVTVLQDHMGIEMEAGELPIGLQDRALEAVKLPRGIVAFTFPSLRAANRSEPSLSWKVQGNFRGEQATDTVRRSLNEGGLHAEVAGWHLPGYDASHWPTASAATAAANSRVTFYRTSFDLDVPESVDIGLSFKFAHVGRRRLRAQLYVNGWQMGKYVSNLGPQTVFPVHGGVLEMRGRNEVGVSVWVLDEEDGWTWDPRRDLELVVDHVVSGEPRDGYRLQGLGWKELRG
ncbi:related to beta-galactosidase precursor [Sporisorium reilianum f. sp. reilianum]|uniref:beta-galactosidase n=1 Tax=Sporisorium reilianum f. sp. reilianum TaxID=72559 RepID=A0A2N8UMN3_9BASI|nr:related to beta-galactosidase precursor [Sporisorium reilianum f. sp. reilianum]